MTERSDVQWGRRAFAWIELAFITVAVALGVSELLVGDDTALGLAYVAVAGSTLALKRLAALSIEIRGATARQDTKVPRE